MDDMTPLVLEPPSRKADSAVIWLHGLGANKTDFKFIARQLQEQFTPNTRYILPQAPRIPVTLNSGFEMPAWYDLKDLKNLKNVNEDELISASKDVIELIDQEIAKGIPSEKIFLAGFSQGGAVILYTAYIAYDKPLAGVIALSTFDTSFNTGIKLNPNATKIPSIHAHGVEDNVVDIQFGKQAFDYLKTNGIHAQWHEYPMRHEASPDEIREIGKWLKIQLYGNYLQ